MDHIARYEEWLAAAELTADERARLIAMTDEEKKEAALRLRGTTVE